MNMIIRFIKYCWTTPYQISWKWWRSCITNILIVTVIIIVFCLLVTSICKSLFRCTGQIGDTIGGITAPIIGLISIILLYKTLKEQQKFNRWTSSEDTLHRIEKILSTCITIEIHKIDGQGINGKITKTSIAELSILLIENKLKLTISEGRLLRSYLKKIILNINKYLKLDPHISTDLNTDIIKSYISISLPIYNAIEKGNITFQLGINNIDYNEGNKNNKGDEDILIQSFKEDKKLYNNLPAEYLPKGYKKK